MDTPPDAFICACDDRLVVCGNIYLVCGRKSEANFDGESVLQLARLMLGFLLFLQKVSHSLLFR